jgi:hypothetical protein
MNRSSSSSSSSLSSLAGTGSPRYKGGLGLSLRSPSPLPPALASDVAFSSQDTATSVPTVYTPTEATESVRSCFKEANKPIPREDEDGSSLTARKRRSVSFALEEPIMYDLLSNLGTQAEESEESRKESSASTSREGSASIPFPTYDSSSNKEAGSRSTSNRTQQLSQSADAPGVFSYIRSGAMSTFSSHTSLSSEDWRLSSAQSSPVKSPPGYLRMASETAVGLSLAIGWLAIGRIVGEIPPQTIPVERQLEGGDVNQSEGTVQLHHHSSVRLGRNGS